MHLTLKQSIWKYRRRYYSIYDRLGKFARDGIVEDTRFLVDKGAVKVLKPSEMIEDKSVTNILQEKRPNSAPLYHGTFNLNETPPIEKLSVIRGIVERQS